MARSVEFVCDVCGKTTKKIVGKLQFIPMIPGVSRSAHSNYTHHADVGECCQSKIFKDVKFTKRMSQAEYQQSRKAS